MIIVALKRKCLVCPESLQNSEVFFQTRIALLTGKAEGSKFFSAIAFAHTKIEVDNTAERDSPHSDHPLYCHAGDRPSPRLGGSHRHDRDYWPHGVTVRRQDSCSRRLQAALIHTHGAGEYTGAEEVQSGYQEGTDSPFRWRGGLRLDCDPAALRPSAPHCSPLVRRCT